MKTYTRKIIKKNNIMLMCALGMIAACSRDQPPRDVIDVSSSDTTALFKPFTSSASSEGIKITYAQASIGSDLGCDLFKTFSDQLNQCAKLPESVKSLATSHCESFGKKAVFLGNKTNLLQMTVSKFECEKN